MIPSDEDPTRGGEGTDIQTPEERHEPIGRLLPEMCTLDCGSINFGDMLYISPTDWLRKQAKLVKESGVKAELECFDTGHVRFANQLIEEGLVEGIQYSSSVSVFRGGGSRCGNHGIYEKSNSRKCEMGSFWNWPNANADC